MVELPETPRWTPGSTPRRTSIRAALPRSSSWRRPTARTRSARPPSTATPTGAPTPPWSPRPDALELATDLDGDGRVDVLTRVLADGTATTDTTPGLPGESWDEGPPAPAPTIDPVTGRWVRGG